MVKHESAQKEEKSCFSNIKVLEAFLGCGAITGCVKISGKYLNFNLFEKTLNLQHSRFKFVRNLIN